MTVTEESAHVELRFGPNGELIDEQTGELLGYAPGHDPAGAGNAPVSLDILTRDFPPQAVKQRSGGGGRTFDYIDVATCIRRLNEATNNKWSFRLVPEATKFVAAGTNKNGLDEHLIIVLGELTIPGLGTRQGVGIQRVAFAGNADDLIKGASGDALKKAATLFGVAIELYGPDLEAMEAPAPQQAQPAQTRQTQAAPMPNRPTQAAPTQSRMNQTIGNLDRARQQGEIGAQTLPDRATRMAAQAQGPRPAQPRTGIDPATIPGVVRGVANVKPATKYDEYFPNTTRMPEIVSYLAECGITPGGSQNMNDCRIAVNQWVKGKFGVDNAVVGTGNWNEKYDRNDLLPMDIGNALAHYAAQLSPEGAAEAAQAQARDTTNDDGWGDESDDVPF